jgi:thiol-disulfide isomerase/thioredoxin
MTAVRKVAGLFLLSICGTSFACSKPADAAGGAADQAVASSKKAIDKGESTKAAPDSVVVYYFHGTRRCPTCLGIQKVIEETIEEKFAKELEADMLVFEELNFEEEKNKPYVEKYQLSFSTMIVTARAGEKVVKWDNAGKIWDYAHAHDDLKAYVEKNIRAYLKLLGAG